MRVWWTLRAGQVPYASCSRAGGRLQRRRISCSSSPRLLQVSLACGFARPHLEDLPQIVFLLCAARVGWYNLDVGNFDGAQHLQSLSVLFCGKVLQREGPDPLPLLLGSLVFGA